MVDATVQKYCEVSSKFQSALKYDAFSWSTNSYYIQKSSDMLGILATALFKTERLLEKIALSSAAKGYKGTESFKDIGASVSNMALWTEKHLAILHTEQLWHTT